MPRAKDDWVKPRSRGQHLCEDEIATIKHGYRNGRTVRDLARELKCSSRTVAKYYGFFREEGARRSACPALSRLPRRRRTSSRSAPSRRR